MKAKTREQYINAWQWHIDQLAILALAAKVEYSEYTETKARLESWITDAAERYNRNTHGECNECDA